MLIVRYNSVVYTLMGILALSYKKSVNNARIFYNVYE